jgi:hypothetical protein
MRDNRPSGVLIHMSDEKRTSRNPYEGSNGKPKLRMSVVTFVDILGYRELIAGARTKRESSALLERLHGALVESRQYVDPARLEDVRSVYSDKDASTMRAFTDNIVIGRPIQYDAYVEIAASLQEISYFQLTMALEGFFVRGGIAVGPIYMDDIAVFGAALTEAYNAEVNLARDPRIVLAASARKIVDGFLKTGETGEKESFNDYVLRDVDGEYFTDYLHTLFREDGQIYMDRLRQHRDKVSEKLIAHRGKPQIWSKYRWAANYHNFICNGSSKVDMALKVDAVELADNPVRLIQP